MAFWDNIKNAVKNVIKANGSGEITGANLQATLLNIISSIGKNATFAGIATPSTSPGIPDGPVFYIATKIGTYSNFEKLDGSRPVIEGYGTILLITNKYYTDKTKWDAVNIGSSIASAYRGGITNINGQENSALYTCTLEEAVNKIPKNECASSKIILFKDSISNKSKIAVYFGPDLSSFYNLDMWVVLDKNAFTLSYLNLAQSNLITSVPDMKSLSDIINDIPASYRVVGHTILFRNTDGLLYIAIFNGWAIMSGWDNLNNWKLIKISDLDKFVTMPQVDDKLASKVTKITGKGLSSNDYTDEEKSKLAALSNIQIPEATIKKAVDNYITTNNEAIAQKSEVLKYQDSYYIRLKETNYLGAVDRISEDWVENNGSYTHIAGTEGILEFMVNAAYSAIVLVTFTVSTNDPRDLYVSLGESAEIPYYNGGTFCKIAFKCDGGNLKFRASAKFDLTISNICIREYDNNGTVNILENNACMWSGPDYKLNHNFWSTIIGNKTTASRLIDASRTIAIGYSALKECSSCNRNVAIGTFSMANIQYGENNVSIGADTTYLLKFAKNCVAIGFSTLLGNADSDVRNGAESCVAIGTSSLAVSTTVLKYACTAVGHNAGFRSITNNTTIGYKAGFSFTGENNIAIGYISGYCGESLANAITGNNLVFIGANSKINPNNTSAKSANNSIAIGADTTITKSNQVVIGNSSISEVILGGKKLIFNADGSVSWEAI